MAIPLSKLSPDARRQIEQSLPAHKSIEYGRVVPTHQPGRMNKTEAAYAAVLELRQHAGEITHWWFEEVKLRLADNCWYTPDFQIETADGHIEYHEVKGFWRDDARVKWKAAADKYSYARFVAVQRIKGEWRQEIYRRG